jgi:hypothetical protein
MSRPIIGLLTALLAAVALAACGGGGDEETTTADFRRDYAPISAAIRGLGTEVGAAVTSAKGKSDLELQEQFADLADRANVVAGDLEEAKTPDDDAINTTRAALVAGVRKAAADLDAISGAAAANDGDAAKAATIRLAKDSEGIREPRRKLDQLVLSSN